MELEVGAIYTGKVSGIIKFGAFVTVAPGKSGLVHISEIANTYVDDINKYLTVGQEVSVKLVSIDENGRINFSIKQAAKPTSVRTQAKNPSTPPRQDNRQRNDSQPVQSAAASAELSFEDKLKRFMQDSDSKISGLYVEKRTSRRRNNGNNR